MVKSRHILVVTGMLLAMLFWGWSFIWYKQVFVAYPPVTVVFLRLVISSVILLAFAHYTGRLQAIRPRDRFRMLLLALFNPFLYFIGESVGVSLVSSSVSAVIISTIPLFTPIAARFYLGEKLKTVNILGILISFLGILIIVFHDGWNISVSPKGLAFLILAVASAVFYAMILKDMTGEYHPITIISIQNTIGAVYFLPLVFLVDSGSFLTTPLSIDVLWPLFKLAIFGSSLAFIFYTYGVREFGTSKANIYGNLIPVITTVLAAIILREPITWKLITGMLVVLTGVLLSQISRVKSREKQRNYHPGI
ncbi:MAG TPA: DMT family transporter [Bacteroidetes bacterium]|nr:DMT family transporter [Bacteroidota bacterium]